MSVSVLNARETAQALPYKQLVPALSQAAQELFAGKISAPERQVVPIGGANVLLSMPAIGADISVTKLITVHPDNSAHELPTIQGEVIVFDTKTGRRLVQLDGPTVTARRTAAMTLLGIDVLGIRKPKSALLIGVGVQAAAHAAALSDYFGIRRFWVAGRDADRTESFCRALSARVPGIEANAISMAQLKSDVPAADVLISLTTSRTPVIPAKLAARTLAIGVGAFKPDMVEFPASLLAERIIVVDDLDGAKHEAGDLIQAKVDWQRVRVLGDLLAGGPPLQGMPIFKTVGQAAWDLAAARVVCESMLASAE